MKSFWAFVAAMIALASFGTTQTATVRPVRITPPQIQGWTFVVSETPTNSGQNWTLANAPLAGSEECYRNGLHEHPGQSYTISGNTLTSPYWQPTDDILCSYRY